ncbi:hypothetical protein PIROE2DRAFT_61073 [Piromyces sp. E2]|nr:hypothetical protein PIROE2DRAFT_61073 [Piromyces sp. E2]|eukprot:OUM63806.1 hypothetical protein PIROE2DRAFT_61073 [Piromyces sp. E2]
MEGTKAYKNKDYKKALDLYTNAIEKCPFLNIVYYNNRAAAYMMVLNYEKAIDDCKKVIRNDNKNVTAYKRIANCYFQLNKPENAKDILEKGLCSCPGDIELQEKVLFFPYNKINKYFIINR